MSSWLPKLHPHDKVRRDERRALDLLDLYSTAQMWGDDTRVLGSGCLYIHDRTARRLAARGLVVIRTDGSVTRTPPPRKDTA